MDTYSLMISVLFGAIGTGLFLYGKKQLRIAFMVSGVALMACPYLISNTVALTVVSLILSIAPFFIP